MTGTVYGVIWIFRDKGSLTGECDKKPRKALTHTRVHTCTHTHTQTTECVGVSWQRLCVAVTSCVLNVWDGGVLHVRRQMLELAVTHTNINNDGHSRTHTLTHTHTHMHDAQNVTSIAMELMCSARY